MKRALFSLTVIVAIAATPEVFSQAKSIGMGVVIGQPTGISAKIWTSSVTAFSFALAWSGGDYGWVRYDGSYWVLYRESRLHVHADYLWHSDRVLKTAERIPVYYGAGVGVNSGFHNWIGVRGVVGIEWLPRNAPLDFFFEVAPVLLLAPSSALAVDAGVGARFLF